MSISDIPALNAGLNGLSTILIVCGIIAIKKGKENAHRGFMFSAVVVSALFLVGYVYHKWAVKGVHTPFGGEGTIELVYYVMLITHIILAMAIVPLVLRVVFLAITRQFEKHKWWARWTYPIWLYVSVTGVLVYFFLYVWFPSHPA